MYHIKNFNKIMQAKIIKKLKDYFNPIILDVINESELHVGHEGSPNTGNSHFFIKMRSKKLNNLSRVEKQRLVYYVLKEEIKNGVHAIRMDVEGI
ncbi:MAG: hypothetical protein CBC87_02910 [Rickettsiales bacterium TMED127]|nr:MAG: hypothetical protein CBC87_02910 [Rickettsiales bacterium TMED127]